MTKQGDLGLARHRLWFSISWICWWLPFTPSCYHVIRWTPQPENTSFRDVCHG